MQAGASNEPYLLPVAATMRGGNVTCAVTRQNVTDELL